MNLPKAFEQLNDCPFIFITQGGNQGDEMIWAGARKLADCAGLDYYEISMKRNSTKKLKPKENTILYINGGGGFNTWWNWTPRLLAMLVELYPENRIIVGPSTVALQKWYLDKWLPKTENLTFYARERTTYNFLKRNYNLNLQLDHDTSLHLHRNDEYLDTLLDETPLTRDHKLAAIREDPESPDVLPSSINLSQYDIIVDPCIEENWVQLHCNASEILTNRSHSAIFGMILGKPTTIFTGKYHKNRSMWEYSMKRGGVKWLA